MELMVPDVTVASHSVLCQYLQLTSGSRASAGKSIRRSIRCF